MHRPSNEPSQWAQRQGDNVRKTRDGIRLTPENVVSSDRAPRAKALFASATAETGAPGSPQQQKKQRRVAQEENQGTTKRPLSSVSADRRRLEDALSRESTAASIKRSLDILSGMDLSHKRARMTPFILWGFQPVECSKAEKDDLLAFVKKHILKPSEEKEREPDVLRKRKEDE